MLAIAARRGEEVIRDGRRLDPQVQAMLRLAGRVSPLENRDVASSRRDMARAAILGPAVRNAFTHGNGTCPGRTDRCAFGSTGTPI